MENTRQQKTEKHDAGQAESQESEHKHTKQLKLNSFLQL